MASINTDIKTIDSGYSSLDADIFVPLDLNWRRKYYRSSFKKRSLAFLMDYFITFIPASLIAYFIGVVLILMFDENGSINFVDVLGNEDYDIHLTIIQLSLSAVLIAIMESSKMKGTFGKRIMKIEITDSYGNSISYWHALLRNILKIISLYAYVFIIPLIIQYFMFRKTKQLFHDKFSDTIVGERLGKL